MKISIITPCKNVVGYIDDAVNSVLSQKGDFSLEYIIVDGASDDGTLQYLQALVKKVMGDRSAGLPPVSIRLISEPDGGMYDALAKGLRLATGDIVAYLNGDDFYLPGAFTTAVDIFTTFPNVHWFTGMATSANTKSGICYTRMDGGFCQKLISKGFYGRLLPFISQESVFFRRDLLAEVDFDRFSRLKYAGDFFLWKSFSSKADIFRVVASLACFRYRPGQISGDIKRYYAEFDALVDKKTIFDWAIAIWCWIVQNAFSFCLRKRLSKNMIQYSVGRSEWEFCRNFLSRMCQRSL